MAMQKITPFLWFDNQAEEAAQFYTSIFKNSRILNVSRYGDAGPGPKGSVMVVNFQLEGQQFTALNGGPLFKFSEAFSFVVSLMFNVAQVAGTLPSMAAKRADTTGTASDTRTGSQPQPPPRYRKPYQDFTRRLNATDDQENK